MAFKLETDFARVKEIDKIKVIMEIFPNRQKNINEIAEKLPQS